MRFLIKVLIIIITFLILHHFKIELFTTENKENEINYFNKNINIKTIIDGKEFYLLLIKSLKCEEIDTNIDCGLNVPILVEKKIFDENLNFYKNKLEEAKEKCKLDNIKYCKERMEEDCETKNYLGCSEIYRNFNGDFKIIKVNDEKIIKIMGNSEMENKLISDVRFLNLKKTNNFICMDNSVQTTDEDILFSMIDTTPNKFKIKIIKKNDNKELEELYIGYCIDKTCNYENNKFFRLCYFKDINNKNILEFTTENI
jgi:hypothetical protein